MNEKKLENFEKLSEFVKERDKKLKFVNEVSELLRKYNFSKDYLNYAYKHTDVESDRHLYNIGIPCYKDNEYSGDIELLVSGTKEEVEEFKKEFSKKVKETYADDENIMFPDDVFVSEIDSILSLKHYIATYGLEK